jgi:hypothetical protein
MELATEARMHASNAQRDLKLIWRRVVRARPPKWAVALLCVGTFVAGWIGGALRGNEEGWERAESFRVAINSKQWERAQLGDVASVQFYLLSGADRAVAAAARANQPLTWRKWLWNAATVSYWVLPDVSDATRERAKQMGERRLGLPPPSPETLAALKAANREWMLQERIRHLESLATAYSQVLGRPIKAEQLVTDWELRLPPDVAKGK